MRYVELGRTGEIVSEMCLGTMMFGDRCDKAESDRILAAAIDHGVNFVDTAAMYCQGYTEEILGRILSGRREKLFITTKVHKGVDGPVEVMEALNGVVTQGKARHVGCCNYPAWLYAHSNVIARCNNWVPLVCNQIPYNLIERGTEVEVLPQAVAEQVAITTYRPLAMGILAGKYQVGEPLPADSRGQTDARIPAWLDKYGQAIKNFDQFATDHNVHPAQLAISWVRHSPAVTSPIVGVSSVKQLQAVFAAFDFDLTAEEYALVTDLFDTEVKEEAGGKFPELRRIMNLVA